MRQDRAPARLKACPGSRPEEVDGERGGLYQGREPNMACHTKPKTVVEVGLLQLATLNKIAASLEHMVGAMRARCIYFYFPSCFRLTLRVLIGGL